MFAVSKEEWLKKFLELPNGIPSHDTMQRVISLLNPETLYSSCIKFLIEKIDSLTIKDETKDVLSMDGKVTKGSSRNKENTEEIVTIHSPIDINYLFFSFILIITYFFVKVRSIF